MQGSSPSRSRFNRLVSLIAPTIAVMAMASSCSSQINHQARVKGQPQLAKKTYTSFDGEKFGYKKWVAKKKQPKVIVIGIHGISGHADDFKTFASYVAKTQPDISIFAAETRGQGTDPKLHRRGDIRSAKDWQRDLYTFTRLIRKTHPKAKIVWFGESMGSLIAMNAYHHPPAGEVRPDGLILASPIVGVEHKLAPWKTTTLRIAAFAVPKFKISLESLSGVQNPTVTKDDIHEQQAAKNPWYVSHFSLRLLTTLGDVSSAMPRYAAHTHCPTLTIHGGKDIFTTEADVKAFHAQFPQNAKDNNVHTRKYYPGSYHLILYDHDREKIFRNISQWLRSIQ